MKESWRDVLILVKRTRTKRVYGRLGNKLCMWWSRKKQSEKLDRWTLEVIEFLMIAANKSTSILELSQVVNFSCNLKFNSQTVPECGWDSKTMMEASSRLIDVDRCDNAGMCSSSSNTNSNSSCVRSCDLHQKKEEGNFVRRLMDKRVFPIKSFPAEMNMQW